MDFKKLVISQMGQVWHHECATMCYLIDKFQRGLGEVHGFVAYHVLLN